MRAAARILAGAFALLVFCAVFFTLSTTVAQDAEATPCAQVIDVPAGVQDEMERIKAYVAEAPDRPLDQVLAVYTYFCLNYEYDYTMTYRGVDDIMVSGTGLCEAYALAFRYVMDELGIPCAYVEGDTPAVYHAWNAVQIDGQWYWLDPTFDDYKADGYRVNRHFFLKSDAVFLENHTPRLWYGPAGERTVEACPSTRFDSFWWNGDDVLEHDAAVPFEGGWAYRSRAAGAMVKRSEAAEGAGVERLSSEAAARVGLQVRGREQLLSLDDVEAAPTVTGISIDGGDLSCAETGRRLTASFAEGSAGALPVVWASSDSTVADIGPDGRLVPKKPGQSVITAKTCDGAHEARVTLTVPGIQTVEGSACRIAAAESGCGMLSWDAVPGARSYRLVLRSQTRGLRFMQHDIVQLEVQVCELELDDMTEREDYYFELSAVFDEGLGNTNILAAYHSDDLITG